MKIFNILLVFTLISLFFFVPSFSEAQELKDLSVTELEAYWQIVMIAPYLDQFGKWDKVELGRDGRTQMTHATFYWIIIRYDGHIYTLTVKIEYPDSMIKEMMKGLKDLKKEDEEPQIKRGV